MKTRQRDEGQLEDAVRVWTRKEHLRALGNQIIALDEACAQVRTILYYLRRVMP